MPNISSFEIIYRGALKAPIFPKGKIKPNSLKYIKPSNETDVFVHKTEEQFSTVTRKVAKIKMTQSGKQVSFSKKTEQMPLVLAEIGKLNFTPPKVKVVAMKYKPSKEHIKTPFRINKQEGEILTDKISLKKTLFNDDEEEEKEEKKDSKEEKKEKDSQNSN